MRDDYITPGADPYLSIIGDSNNYEYTDARSDNDGYVQPHPDASYNDANAYLNYPYEDIKQP